MIIHENVRTQLTQGGGHLDEGGARHGLVPLVVVLKQASSAACGLNNDEPTHITTTLLLIIFVPLFVLYHNFAQSNTQINVIKRDSS
jgi:hypothetical protein